MSEFTADTKIEDALKVGDSVVQAFQDLGLKCVMCVAQEVETLRHAALYHEKNLDEILKKLNEARRRAEKV